VSAPPTTVLGQSRLEAADAARDAARLSHRCNLCHAAAVRPIVDFGSHPIAHHLLHSPDEDEYTHPVVLGFCEECGLSQLIDPIPPERLYTSYTWLTGGKWNPHVPRLLELIDQLKLSREAKVIEVGSNDGSFLAELRERGFRRLLGVEPAADAVDAAGERGIDVVRGYFAPALALELAESHGPFDFFIGRQVLEHVSQLDDFAAALRTAMRPGGYVLAEVPDFRFFEQAPDYSALWEEHPNHFTTETFAHFFARAGVEVLHDETALFSGKVIVVVGRFTGAPVPAPSPPVATLREEAESYRARWPRFREEMHGYLDGERRAGKRIMLYGAGCRSTCVVNYTGLAPHLDAVVDDHPAKHGKFMAGSRLPIVQPSALVEREVSLCLLGVNAENEDAVISRNADFVARGGEFVSIHPPSPRLPPFWQDC
jgi:SAM-dependent methyltransferase